VETYSIGFQFIIQTNHMRTFKLFGAMASTMVLLLFFGVDANAQTTTVDVVNNTGCFLNVSIEGNAGGTLCTGTKVGAQGPVASFSSTTLTWSTGGTTGIPALLSEGGGTPPVAPGNVRCYTHLCLGFSTTGTCASTPFTATITNTGTTQTLTIQ